jgi:C4-dicarboxylate-specific signal transduction histidine kinase
MIKSFFVVLILAVLAPTAAFADAAADLRKTCTEAMNADPKLADDVVRIAEEKRAQKIDDELILNDRCTLKLHQDAQDRIAKNERHVILAYAAMWLVAVGFVVFLWRRQQALKAEIAQLRRDLDAAAKEPT